MRPPALTRRQRRQGLGQPVVAGYKPRPVTVGTGELGTPLCDALRQKRQPSSIAP
jgi:hypothetical protein